MLTLPVIHHLDRETSIAEAQVARKCGADGVFLISHHGDDDEIVSVASELKVYMPEMKVGINLLSRSPKEACAAALESELDMVWADHMGVNSSGVDPLGLWLSEFAKDNPAIKLFASVAFKYQAIDPNPSLAAAKAKQMGFVPTTSGSATGSAPELSKIRQMSHAVNGELAVASGMTPENILGYAPFLAYALVSTGISKDEYHIDEDKLCEFVGKSKTRL